MGYALKLGGAAALFLIAAILAALLFNGVWFKVGFGAAFAILCAILLLIAWRVDKKDKEPAPAWKTFRTSSNTPDSSTGNLGFRCAVQSECHPDERVGSPRGRAGRRSYLRTLVFAALLGIPVALAAVLFQSALHHATDLVWEEIPDALDWSEPTWWYVVLVTGLAGVLVAAALRLPGHGGHSPLEGLGLGATRSSSSRASCSPRGDACARSRPRARGSAHRTRPRPRIRRGAPRARGGNRSELLVLAGAFAAIAALFGGPLVAAFLILELAVASGAIPARAMGRALLPGFVAAGTGALVFTGVGDWPGLERSRWRCPACPPTTRSGSPTSVGAC